MRRCKKKSIKRVMALGLCVLLLLCPLTTVSAAAASYGDVVVTLPNETSETYDVTFSLKYEVPTAGTNSALSSMEQFFLATYTKGGVETTVQLKLTHHWNLGYNATLTGVDKNSTITLQDVLVSGKPDGFWGEITQTEIAVIAMDTSGTQLAMKQNPRKVTDGTNLAFEAGEDVLVFPHKTQLTSEDFESQGGEYDLRYFLTHYNVVSLDDIESTHIVGPILAVNSAYRTSDNPTTDHTSSKNQLVASDYAKGISSYVGTVLPMDIDPADASLLIGYGFEHTVDMVEVPDFCPPDFYMRETEFDGGLVSVTANELHKEFVTLHDAAAHFPAPNAGGRTLWNKGTEEAHTYQSDTFLDVGKLRDALIADSAALLTAGVLEGETPNGAQIVIDSPVQYPDGVLQIEVGKSYLIEETAGLTGVNIHMPQPDYYDNDTIPPTTINFSGKTINPTTIRGQLYSQFPTTFVNGKEFDAYMGKDGEYNEVGNKIIWNMPNLVTDVDGSNRLVTYNGGANIAGHMVAPQAEFWNYDGNAVAGWEGGNLNGAGIFKDFHSGNMEMHMWPYTGLDEKSVAVSLQATKILTNGNLENWDFLFALNLTSGTASNVTNTLPMYATSNAAGKIAFDALHFKAPGTYTFTMQEVEGKDGAHITYDTTVHTVTVVVDDAMNATVTYPGGGGVPTFTNIKNNTSLIFTKTDDLGNPLPGAIFTVTDGANSKTYTSRADGTFMVELEKDKTYTMTETTPPAGYAPSLKIWTLTVSAEGVITVTDELGNHLNHHTIPNTPSEIPTIGVGFYKQDETGVALPGAVFQVQKVVKTGTTDRYDTLVEGGYLETVTSDAQGVVAIVNLPVGYAYRLTEVTAPAGFTPPAYTWLLVIGDTPDAAGNYPYTLQLDNGTSYEDITNGVLVNYSAFRLPLTGGMGTAPLYLLGGALMALAVYLARKQQWN